MIRKKYDVDYADDVNMWEIVRFNDKSEEWECMGLYDEDERKANIIADILECAYVLGGTNE